MKVNKKKTVRNKIRAWFIALSLGPLVLLTLSMFIQRGAMLREASLDKLTAIRDLKVNGLKRWYNEQHLDIEGLSGMQPFRKLEVLITNTDQSVRESEMFIIQEIMNDHKKIRKNSLNLYFVDISNNAIAISTNSGSIGENLIGKDFYKKIGENGGHYHSNIYYSDLDNNYTMTFSSPVHCNLHNKAHLLGYLFGNLDLEFQFYPLLLERGGLGESGEMLIVDENLIAQNELRWYYDAPQRFKIDTKPANLAAAGSTGTIIANDYRGEKIIAAYTHLPEQNWGFVCKQDYSEVNKSINQLLINMIVLFIVFAFIAMWVAIWIGNAIATPLIEMDHVIAKIRAGDYSARSKIYTRDEFGSLANLINDMAERTEERIYSRKSISDLATAMLETTTVPDFGNKILAILSSFCDAKISSFHILDASNAHFEPVSSIGKDLDSFKLISVKYPKDEFKITIKQGNSAINKKIPKNCVYRISDAKASFIPKEIYTMPIISESSVVALIGLATNSQFSEQSIRLLQISEAIINAAYTTLIARERSRIFSEQLYRINNQIQEKSGELEERAEELNRQKLILEDTTKKLQNKNEELEIQKKVVERANKDLELFSYSVSHDLRAPLRAIRGFSDILVEDYSAKLGAEGARIAKVILQNTERMNALIKDLLELSRVGRKARNVSKVNMKEMANSIYHEAVDKSMMEKIDLKIDNISNINGDPNLLRQVWMNLISNAVKFSSTRKKIKIQISSNNKDGYTIYSVKDNGVGFDAQYQDKLFGVFQRLHTEDEFEGTGVGLAIVKQIINKHNGEIWAESILGKGSTFYFSLPKD